MALCVAVVGNAVATSTTRQGEGKGSKLVRRGSAGPCAGNQLSTRDAQLAPATVRTPGPEIRRRSVRP
eukprot:2797169-Prymnesium_polylepis.1